MELDVNVITCLHREGTAKETGRAYSFYTGSVYVLGGVVDYMSNAPLIADISKTQKARVSLSPAGNGAVKVKLEPVGQ